MRTPNSYECYYGLTQINHYQCASGSICKVQSHDSDFINMLQDKNTERLYQHVARHTDRQISLTCCRAQTNTDFTNVLQGMETDRLHWHAPRHRYGQISLTRHRAWPVTDFINMSQGTDTALTCCKAPKETDLNNKLYGTDKNRLHQYATGHTDRLY